MSSRAATTRRRATATNAAGWWSRGYWSLDWMFAVGVLVVIMTPLVLPGTGPLLLGMLAAFGWFRRRTLVQDLVATSPALPFVFLAVASTLWSDNRVVTLKYSIEFGLTALFGVLIARRQSGAQLVGSVFSAFLIVGLLSLALGSYGFDENNEYVWLGVFGSKNAFATSASVMVLSGAAVALDGRQPGVLRLAGLAGIALGAIIGLRGHSLGATVGTALTLAVFLAVSAMRFLNLTWRMLAVATVIAVSIPVAFVLPELQDQAETFASGKLGKDTTTLTGRTYLWDRAKDSISEKPLLGHGYQAFWVQGSLDAEGLWRYAKIKERAGFNFHNQFVETTVEMGYVGLATLILTLAAMGVGLVVRLVRAPSATLGLAAALYVYIVLRTPLEVLITPPFGYVGVLFFATAVIALGLDKGLAGGRMWAALATKSASLRAPRRTAPATR